MNNRHHNEQQLSDKEYQDLVNAEVEQCAIPTAQQLENESIILEQQTAGPDALSSCGRFLTKTFLSIQMLKRILLIETINVSKPTSFVRIFLIQYSINPANVAYRIYCTDPSDKQLEQYSFFQVHLAARLANNWSEAGAAGFEHLNTQRKESDQQSNDTFETNYFNINNEDDNDDDEDDDDIEIHYV